MSAKDIKLVLFTGRNRIPIDHWLNLLEVVIAALKDDKEKVVKFMSYLDEDALNFYATKVAPKLSTITWAETRQLMERRFGVSQISPIVAATRRRLLSPKQ
jgi:hypothetical protein